MELTTESEKEPLIEPYLEPLTRMSPPEERHSHSEFSEGATGVDCLLQPESLCEETERDARRVAKRKLLIACAVSLVFMTGEVIGGFAARSLAIMTDAAHLLTDFGSIVISIFSLLISSRPRTQTMTFGWHRAEILGMLLSIVSIWAVTAVLVSSAVQRITDGDYDIDSRIMLITSGCAVGVNILMVRILHQSGASHGHGHEGPRSRLQREKRPHGHSHSNASVRAAFIHVLGDLLQSVGVLVAATIIHFRPEFKAADPICTFLFSVLVIGTTVPVTKDIFRILMEGAPRGVSSGAVRELLLSVGEVAAVNNLHMWSLNMNHSLLSAHITIDEGADAQVILRKATERLRSEFGFTSVTIQVAYCKTSAAR